MIVTVFVFFILHSVQEDLAVVLVVNAGPRMHLLEVPLTTITT